LTFWSFYTKKLRKNSQNIGKLSNFDPSFSPRNILLELNRRLATPGPKAKWQRIATFYKKNGKIEMTQLMGNMKAKSSIKFAKETRVQLLMPPKNS
jgi:hypothetical protein